MLFSLLFILFMATISIITTTVVLMLVLNLRIVKLAETNHWLNKLILFQQKDFEEEIVYPKLSGASILGLDPVDATSGGLVSEWFISHKAKIEITGEAINNAVPPISRMSTRGAENLLIGSI